MISNTINTLEIKQKAKTLFDIDNKTNQTNRSFGKSTNNLNKPSSSFYSLINFSTNGRNKHPINLKHITLTPDNMMHETASFNNLQCLKKQINDHFLPGSNRDKSKIHSSFLPKVISCNNNQAFFRSTSRVIQVYNQKNHIVNKKEAEILKRLYKEDQNFILRLNKIKRNYNLALKQDFRSEWYQTLLLNESVKNISSKGLKRLQVNFNKINFIVNRKPHDHRFKIIE